MDDDTFAKFKLVSIEAWRTCENTWDWNNIFTIEKDIFISRKELTSRKILAMLRRWDYLTNYSKGKLRVDFNEYCIEIQDKNTFEPLLALIYEE